MKVKDLNGNSSTWKIRGEIVSANDNRSRSKLHLKARKILYGLFPTMQILEEVSINPRIGKTQYLDFYINQIKLAIEVHGQQHYKFNSLYHATAQDFLNQKKNDADKKNWCDINNISYIELPYNEDEDSWTIKIQNR
jgi:hypothetical protein